MNPLFGNLKDSSAEGAPCEFSIFDLPLKCVDLFTQRGCLIKSCMRLGT
jgi:hypothetical protein